jgi:hypothetical protein
MRKKKTDPNQLMLDFEGARTRFQTAARDLVQAADALVRDQPETCKQVRSQVSGERRFFNYLVRTLAFSQLEGDFRAAYVKVYDQFARSYTSHPALDMEPGERFVDAAERCGQLPMLTRTVKRMLAYA